MQTNNEQLHQELISFLRQDELDYPAGAARFGKEALPLLNDLISSNDENLATKSAYLAGYIGNEESVPVLEKAAQNKFSTVRIAAAFGARSKKPEAASRILQSVLDDSDAGVLKTAIQSVDQLNLSNTFQARLKNISLQHQDAFIKEFAEKAIKPQ